MEVGGKWKVWKAGAYNGAQLVRIGPNYSSPDF